MASRWKRKWKERKRGNKKRKEKEKEGKGKKEKEKTPPSLLQVAGFICSDATASYVLSVSITAHTEISGKLQAATQSIFSE